MTHRETQAQVPVLFIASGASAGGAETHLRRLVARLQQDRYHIIVVCKPDSYLARTLPHKAVEVWKVDIPSWRKFGGRLRMPLFVSRISEKAKSVGVRLVVANDFWTAPHTLRIAKRIGVPSICLIQDSLVDAKKSRNYHLSSFGTIITVSEAMRSRLSEFLASESIRVIPCGLDTSEFHPNVDGSSLRRTLGIRNDDVLILTVGQICPMKGQDRLLKALVEEIQNGKSYHIAFCGRADTPLADEIRTLAQKHFIGDRLHFLGMREDMPQCYAAAEIFVCLSERESFGLAMAEAMASGKSCLYANCPALVELAGEECGIEVDRDNGGSIRAAVNTLEGNADLRGQLGTKARARIETQYDIRNEATQFSEVLDEFL